MGRFGQSLQAIWLFSIAVFSLSLRSERFKGSSLEGDVREAEECGSYRLRFFCRSRDSKEDVAGMILRLQSSLSSQQVFES